MLRQIERVIIDQRLLRRGTRGVVAFSGGPDSLCLLHLLSRLATDWGLDLLALCVDHGLREASPREMAQAAELARSLGVAARVVRLQGAPSGNLQQWAREQRWCALREAALQGEARWIATGHTADDQAETVLMRALRGAGPAGLSAMARRQLVQRGVWLVRPLLHLRRSQVVAYLERHGLRPLIDPSNATPEFLRNRMRQRVLPVLARENPAVVEALCRLADNCREEHAALAATATRLLQEAEGPDGFGVEVLRGMSPGLQAQALREIYAAATGSLRRLGRAHVEAMRRLLARSDGTQRLSLPGAVVVRRYGRLLVQGRGVPSAPMAPWVLDSPADLPCETRLPDGRVLRVSRGDGPRALAVHSLAFPLMIRAIEPGDRIAIGGGKRRKVARLLIDAKIPLTERRAVPVVQASDGRVVLVVGIRRAAGLAPDDPESALCIEVASSRVGLSGE
jgi:tRNA(Ile)-lysidine synthase